MVKWSRSKEANEWCFLGHAFLDVQDAVSNKKTQNRDPPKIGKKAFEKDDADDDDDDGM